MLSSLFFVALGYGNSKPKHPCVQPGTDLATNSQEMLHAHKKYSPCPHSEWLLGAGSKNTLAPQSMEEDKSTDRYCQWVWWYSKNSDASSSTVSASSGPPKPFDCILSDPL